MASFLHLKSALQLAELAKNPINLAQEKNFSVKRLESMKSEALGLSLCYGSERVDEEVLTALANLAEESSALQKMQAMQSGEIMNAIEGYESERRPVLHTAMRDFFDQCNGAKVAQEATKLAYQELEKLKRFLKEIEAKQSFTDLVQIGIGGSELGPKAVYIALEAYHKPGRRVHFLSNVDPDDSAHIFRQLDLSKTLIVVVSKSGSTLETLTNEYLVREELLKAGLQPKDHLISVTGEGSPIDESPDYLASFHIWDYIGGRYSATSMVGAVAITFALGMDRFLDFLRGASHMDKVALNSDLKSNLPLLSALLGIWNRNFLHHSTCAIIPYSQALARFPAHLEQLDMESNGKSIDKQGQRVDFETSPIIWGEPGTNGQHSFFQSLHQGTTVVPIEFIGFKESQYSRDLLYEGSTCQEKLLSNLFAQSIALSMGQKSSNPNQFFAGNRPNRILLANKLDPYNMGAILAYYEHKVAFQGFIWNINSFDQEGVQLGKVLALKMIDLFKHKRQGKGMDGKTFPLGQVYLNLLGKI